MEISKEVIVIGLKKVEPEIQKQIVEFLTGGDNAETPKQVVFLDDEMYNANLSAIYKKILKIKGEFDLDKFKSDPENIKNVEIWRDNFEKQKVTLFRVKDLVLNFKLKYSDAKLLLNQLELFGLVVDDEESGEGWFKFIPNDAARLFHLTEVLGRKAKEYSVLEEQFLTLKKKLIEIENKTKEAEKQKTIDGYLGKNDKEIETRELKEGEMLESVPVENINKDIKESPLHIVRDEEDVEEVNCPECVNFGGLETDNSIICQDDGEFDYPKCFKKENENQEDKEQKKDFNPILDFNIPVVGEQLEEMITQEKEYKSSLKDAHDDLAK